MPTSAVFTTREITNWSQIAGNQEVIQTLLNTRNFDDPPKVFLAGPSGSCKSTLANHFCRVLACFEPQADNPCGRCCGCEKFKAMDPEAGLHAIEDHHGRTRHYLHINCRHTTPAKLHESLEWVRDDVHDSIRVIHLEEVGNLKRLECDESITGLMDHFDFRTCHWLATAVSDACLDEQFRRRWDVQITTRRPSDHEVAILIATLCHENEIEIDHPATLELLAEKSWGVVGLAVRVLTKAMLAAPHRLTERMVRDQVFPVTDPWTKTFFAAD